MESCQATGNSPTMDYSRPQCTKKVWPIDDDIVIAGIGGRFPESDNMDELTANLLNNVDMVTRDDRRWPIGLNDNQASRSGKIKNLDKFDNTYFCTLQILAESMEPGSRIILETTYEAIADAGIAPQSIRGSKTGVYVGINTVANAEAIPQDDFSDVRAKEAAFWVYGSSKALLANRISFLFDFTGPSTVIDTACSASMVALANAVQDLRSGNCDMAVVATTNICLAPYSSYIFHSLGLLSADGKCKVFDKSADGFVRSESVGSIFLMRRSQAKRIYATILHAKTNTDGFKTIGLFAPFWLRQRNLMIETFQEAGVEPEEVTYFESHGTGTNVGDPQEAKAVSEAYCQNRKDKLLVGAVKSNLGHTEGASGLCSVAKAIIIFENQMIPANLHFNSAKEEIESLHKTIEPVVSNLPFDGKIIGVNSFGVGGVNAHALLKANEKSAAASIYEVTKPMARLVTVCGRTEEGVEHIFNFIENNPRRAHCDFLALLNDAMKTTPIKGSANFPTRGYMIIKDKDGVEAGVDDPAPYEYIKRIEDTKRLQPVWLIFTGMGSQWVGMGAQMLKLKLFRDSIEASAKILAAYDIDLLELILSDNASLWEARTVYSFVAITAMQIALFDVFRALDLPIDGIIGHSFGEIACAYADGCLTAEQAVLTSYWRGRAVEESADIVPKGLLAAVGLTWEEASKYVGDGVYLACHNGHDSVTVSGRYEPMLAFIERLKAEGIFVRKVAGGEFPYHSQEMNKVAPKLLAKLDQVIVEPKVRSSKWISTSVPLGQNDDEGKASHASGAYFVNNLISPVLFDEGMQLIPKKALCIEMAPHSLFDSIFKRCFKELNYVSLMRKTEPDQLLYFLGAVGHIYTYGLNPSIERLYPPVSWPVAKGTPSVASLIRWEHSYSHDIKMYPEFHNFSTAANFIYRISVLESDWRFLKDHCIDGRAVFPATGYLMLVWRAMATKVGQPWHKVPVHFENIRITRPTLLSETGHVKFVVQIIDKSGDFVICEGNNLVCNGKVKTADSADSGEPFLALQGDIDQVMAECEGQDMLGSLAGRLEDGQHLLAEKEIYKELRIRGYDYGHNFQGLTQATGDGKEGLVKWTGNWISFVDSALHLSLLALPIRTLFVPVGIDSFKCDPVQLFEAINKAKEAPTENAAAAATKVAAEESAVVTNTTTTTQPNDQMNKQQLKTEFHYFKEIAQKNDMLPEEDQICEIAKNDDTIPFEIMNFTFEGGANQVAAQNEKKILFPVTFDWPNQTLVTKGLEVKGMLPINIPRKVETGDLMLEAYRFTPFEQSVQTEDALHEYRGLLGTYFNRVVRKFGLDTSLLLPEEVPAPAVSDDKLRTVYLKKPEYAYLQTLNAMLTSKVEADRNGEDGPVVPPLETAEQAIKFLQEEANKFALDVLNKVGALCCSEAYPRPMFELIADNCQHLATVKVLEICLGSHLAYESVERWLKMNVIHKFELNYTATKHEGLCLPAETTSLKTIEWKGDSAQFLDDQQDQFDLIVLHLDDHQLWTPKDNRNKLVRALRSSGFLLTIERNRLSVFEQKLVKVSKLDFGRMFAVGERAEFGDWPGMKTISKREHCFNDMKLCLYRLESKVDNQNLSIVRLDSAVEGYDQWLKVLQDEVNVLKANEENEARRLWIVAKGEDSGVLGLHQCLRLEPALGGRVRLLFLIAGKDIEGLYRFDPKDAQVQDLIAKDLVVNIYRDGQHGAYRFLRLPEEQQKRPTKFAYLSQTQRGDLSSLEWFESEHRFLLDKVTPVFGPDSKELLCHVYYSALNFKDIVLASGKLIPGPESSLFDCILGLEFAGRRADTGDRVMGMVPFKGIATTVLTHRDFLWSVPAHWSLEEAASVPVIYITAYYALVMRGRLKKGDTVLIHSGAGGVGQAAINICQHLGCTIFVSVGTDAKRAFLRTKFGLDDQHICNSRDVSFERQVKSATRGRGVDVVLNSLTGDKLLASFRCLAVNGRFLEIGKYDMQMNTALGMFPFLNNISFHGVGLDCFFREGFHSNQLAEFIGKVSQLIAKGIDDGVVRPIERTVFARAEAERAFRYMTNGQHIGKVLIEIRPEERPQLERVLEPPPVELNAIARTWFHPAKVYVVAGGLGGVGLELIYWMVLRGARKLILTSRSGLKSAYQKVFLERFRIIEQFCADYKITFQLSTKNIGHRAECAQLLAEARELGTIGGIFNLTLVLEDGLFENQTPEKFEAVCRPKLDGLRNLDRLTRQQPKVFEGLDHFVTFSSFSAGRGNAGQTNYGYANSAMERIVERRVEAGLPGLAIQFGPINDVGVVAEHVFASEEEGGAGADEQSMKLLMGLSMQRLNSCLEVLDRLLPRRVGVFSSYVRYANNADKGGTDDEVIRQLCIHLNIDKRPEDECLGDIGLDSMAAVEIQQRLERDFNISLTLADVRKITVKELKNFRDGNRHNLKQYSDDIKKAKANLSRIRFVIPSAELSALNTIQEHKPIYCLPPLKGVFDLISFLTKRCKRPIIAMNWTRKMNELATLKEAADHYYRLFLKFEAQNPEGFDVLATSFGSLLAALICKSKRMSKKIKFRRLILIDLLPVEMEKMTDEAKKADYRLELLFNYIRIYIPERICQQSLKEIKELNDERERIRKVTELLQKCVGTSVQGGDMKEIIENSYRRGSMMLDYHFAIRRRSKATLKRLLLKVLQRNPQLEIDYIKMIDKRQETIYNEKKLISMFDLDDADLEEYRERYRLHVFRGGQDDFLGKLDQSIQTELDQIFDAMRY